MADYTRKTEMERARMGDDELLEWIATARAAGDLDHARDSCGMLAFRHEERIRGKIAIRVPRAYVEDVFMDVMASVTRSAFDGTFLGQFGSWVNTIAFRRSVDFWRKNGAKIKNDRLFEEEHEGEEGVWVSEGLEDKDVILVEYREVAEAIRITRNDTHQTVIRIYGWVELGYLEFDAASTAEEIERITGEKISEANIHQIWRRFVAELRTELEKAGGDET